MPDVSLGKDWGGGTEIERGHGLRACLETYLERSRRIEREQLLADCPRLERRARYSSLDR